MFSLPFRQRTANEKKKESISMSIISWNPVCCSRLVRSNGNSVLVNSPSRSPKKRKKKKKPTYKVNNHQLHTDPTNIDEIQFPTDFLNSDADAICIDDHGDVEEKEI